MDFYMFPEEQMPHSPPLMYYNGGSRIKPLAVVIIIIYLSFLFTIATLNTSFVPMMEEAGEETAELISTGEAGAGGSVQVIHNDMAQEIRTAYIITLISFGILDGLFALMLWLRKVKRNHETALATLATIQIINRPLSAFLIVQFSILAFVNPNPRLYMNTLFLVIIISSAVSLILALISYFYLLESKTQKIAFKILEEAQV
jgi:hypothetical protein